MRPRVLRLPISHYCHKVDWALADHGIEADQTVLWFRDLIDIRSINPENTVPILELEDRIICGSAAIMQWIADTADAEATLYPSDEARKWEAWADEVIGPLSRRDAYRTLYEKPTRYTRNPLVWVAAMSARGLILNVIKSFKGRRYYDQDDLDRPEVLTRIAEQLRAHGPYLFGDSKSAADYAVAALLEPMLRIRAPSQQHPDWDFLKDYLGRVKARRSPYRSREKFGPDVRARLEAKAGKKGKKVAATA